MGDIKDFLHGGVLPAAACIASAGIMELVLLCGLLVLAGIVPAQGGILNLEKMIWKVTGKMPIKYWTYGCYCGIGGKGQPKDGTDWCCQKHDCCYAHLRTHKCKTWMDHYKYTFYQGEIQCSVKGSWCKQQLCACDSAMALCLKDNLSTYQKKLQVYWRPSCKGPTPACRDPSTNLTSLNSAE
ncbi:group IID secretory phospholipase A2 [Ctenodactylus gundi]